MKDFLYKFGRWVGGHPGQTFFFVIAGWIIIGTYMTNEKSVAPKVSAASERAVFVADPRVEACGAGMESRRSNAKAAFKNKDYEGAYNLMAFCSGRMDSASAEYKEFMAYADAKVKNSAIQAAKQEKAEKARRKKEGVTLGMSQQEVLDSMWGRPEKINRTTSTYGVREQWVYSSGNYLYFEDGKLTTIQN